MSSILQIRRNGDSVPRAPDPGTLDAAEPAVDLLGGVLYIGTGTGPTDYPLVFSMDNPSAGDPWANKVIGELVPMWDHLIPNMEPPTDQHYRFIVLTASSPYNSGVLINESISGTGAGIVATAQINLSTSPLNGITISLINTNREFLRAGTSGIRQWHVFESHTHAASTAVAGWHGHTGVAAAAGNHNHPYNAPTSTVYAAGPVFNALSGGGITGGTTGDAGNHSHTISIDANGNHSHTVTVSNTGSDETRPRNIGVTYYLRIR